MRRPPRDRVEDLGDRCEAVHFSAHLHEFALNRVAVGDVSRGRLGYRAARLHVLHEVLEHLTATLIEEVGNQVPLREDLFHDDRQIAWLERLDWLRSIDRYRCAVPVVRTVQDRAVRYRIAPQDHPFLEVLGDACVLQRGLGIDMNSAVQGAHRAIPPVGHAVDFLDGIVVVEDRVFGRRTKEHRVRGYRVLRGTVSTRLEVPVRAANRAPTGDVRREGGVEVRGPRGEPIDVGLLAIGVVLPSP